MATINHGVMGGFSGKVGTVVGGNWNGIDYMRTRQPKRNDAKSNAQLDQRLRFSTVVQFLKPFKPFFNVGFKNRKAGISVFNAATSVNLRNAITGTYPDYSIDYSKVKVSMGTMPSALNPAVVNGPADELLFTWENNYDRIGALGNDKVVLLVYNPYNKKLVTLFEGNSRMAGNQAFTLPNGFGRENLQCYIAFRNARLTDISDSQYVGSINI
ncbi:MAG TPA: DUF6266 family protein [Prolixibacteraceae bacterium]|nr:DUF6266 family protein [Prolixibacteraceae bacterium]